MGNTSFGSSALTFLVLCAQLDIAWAQDLPGNPSNTRLSQMDSGSVGEEKPRATPEVPAKLETTEDGQGHVAQAGGMFQTSIAIGAWRFRQLQERSVQSEDGETIGRIEDVIVSPNGRLDAILVSIGGVLGLGDRTIAIVPKAFGAPMSGELDEASGDADAANDGAGHTGGDQADIGQNGTAGGRDPNAIRMTRDARPGPVVLHLSRTEVEAAPAFAP